MAVVSHVFVRDISAYNSLSYGRIACNGALDLRLYFYAPVPYRAETVPSLTINLVLR